jgi:hypothetical protein
LTNDAKGDFNRPVLSCIGCPFIALDYRWYIDPIPQKRHISSVNFAAPTAPNPLSTVAAR